MKITRIQTIILIATLLFGGVVWASSSLPVAAQGLQPTQTPNPTITVLENFIATQKAEIDALNNRLEDEERDRKYFDRDIQWKWGIAGSVGAAAIIVASWFGISKLNDLRLKLDEAKTNWEKHVTNLEKEWELRSQLLLDRALYKFDPSNLPIKLPIDATKIHQLLSHRKLGKIEFYENLMDLKGKDLMGVVVVFMLDKDTFASKEEEFRKFVKARKLDSALTGIILYTGQNRASEETTAIFDNLVTANYPGTVISNIIVVGRGLKYTEE